MKHIVIFGAGLVTGPLVKYLLEKGYRITVANRTVSKAQKLVGNHPRGAALAYDIETDSDGATLKKLVGQADLVVSLLPYIHHVTIAKECITQRTQMVTTSYVSEPMRALDSAAKEAGIIILNEVGLDPGIDHMSAMKIIHGVQQAGGHIDGFMSYCGGLPAPEANNNPFGYKFSWSPRGVLLAARNPAHYVRDGQEVSVAGADLFKHYWPLNVAGLGEFEAYPNRDSVPYKEIYGIQNTDTMYRGTLRNLGWCNTLDNIVRLGFLSQAAKPIGGKTYAQFMRDLLPPDAPDTGDIQADLAAHLDIAPDSKVINDLVWLGLFDDRPIEGVDAEISPLDLLTREMLARMEYNQGERDLIILVHHFDASYPDGKKEHITSTLIAFGDPDGYSAMARTVSLPAAIAVDLIVQGKITATGVQIPVTPNLYEPILNGLEKFGIECMEKIETV